MRSTQGFTTKQAERSAHVLMSASEASTGSKPVRGFTPRREQGFGMRYGRSQRTTQEGTSVLRAFTLIELLVVIAIIGVLASVVLVSINSARFKANDANLKASLHNFQQQAALYYDTYGTYGTGPINSALVCMSSTPYNGPCGTSIFTCDQPAVNMKNQVFTIATANATSDGYVGGICRGVIAADGQSYALTTYLKNSIFWCVDSSGNAKSVSSFNWWTGGTAPATCP